MGVTYQAMAGYTGQNQSSSAYYQGDNSPSIGAVNTPISQRLTSLWSELDAIDNAVRNLQSPDEVSSNPQQVFPTDLGVFAALTQCEQTVRHITERIGVLTQQLGRL